MKIRTLVMLGAVLALGNIYGMNSNSLIARGGGEHGGGERGGQFHEGGMGEHNHQPGRTDAAYHAGENRGFDEGVGVGVGVGIAAPEYYAPPPEYYPDQNMNENQNNY